ncbi:hypothetical protein ACI78V_05110 [Geodermatophilus sp. SYSU D00742]
MRAAVKAESATPAKESVEEFLTRGGQIRKLPPGTAAQGPAATAVPQSPADDLSRLGEAPEAAAVHPTSRSRAGVSPERSHPSRGQERPALPSGPGAPRGRIVTFREGFADPKAAAAQQEILDLARADPKQAGRLYEELVAGDFQGGHAVRNAYSRPGRRMDIGTEHEATIEGRTGEFSAGKLDQLWDDLVDKGNATVTVPRLSPAARDQLERMAAQAKQLIKRSTVIVVRETLP